MVGYLRGLGFFRYATLNSIVEKLNSLESETRSELSFFSSDHVEMIFTTKEKILLERVIAIGQGPISQDVDYQIAIARKILVPATPSSPTSFVSSSCQKYFNMMNASLCDEIGRGVIISSGYRSPYYHAMVFLKVLAEKPFTPNQAYERVAPPRHSEHCDPYNPAIDIQNEFGLPTFHEPHLFGQSGEYMWLKKNAGAFFFIQTHADSEFDLKEEAWHWRYCQ